jgi:drug/metabolite transporter (DMT)-like permease
MVECPLCKHKAEFKSQSKKKKKKERKEKEEYRIRKFPFQHLPKSGLFICSLFFFIFFYLFVLAILGLELKDYTLSQSSNPFFSDFFFFFEIGSHKLFAWAGFKP